MDRAHQVGIQTAIAVVAALLLTSYFNFYNAYWAIITIFILSAEHAEESIASGILRVLGTFIGVIVGFIFVIFVARNHFLFYLALFIIPFVGVYQSEKSKHAYAWILGSATAYMMLIASTTGRDAVYTIATLRSLEISIGAIIAVITAHLIFYKKRSRRIEKNKDNFITVNQATKHALKIALSSWLTFYIWAHTGWTSAVSGMVTAYVIAFQPDCYSSITKSLERLLGCGIGAMFGLLISPFIQTLATLAFCMLFFSYFFAWFSIKYVKYRYSVLQAAAAFSIVLISPNNMFTTNISPALERLFGIFLGMICAIIVANILWPNARSVQLLND